MPDRALHHIYGVGSHKPLDNEGNFDKEELEESLRRFESILLRTKKLSCDKNAL